MAITLKADPAKGWKTMELFKVSPVLIQQAKIKGIVVVTTSPGVYTIKNKAKVFSNVPIKTTVISLVEQHSLGPGSLEQYKFQFEQGLKKAIEATPDPEQEATKPMEEVQEALTASSAWPMPKVPFALEGYKAANTKAVKKTPLKDATNIYEPVQGTNLGSTYFTFAFFPGLKLAARIHGTNLSVRAEGDALASYLPELQTQLLIAPPKDGAKTYASSHFKDVDKHLIVKTLAAIIGVIGFHNAEKVADLKKFVFEYAS